MESFYRFNIAKNGEFYLRIDDAHLSKGKAGNMYSDLLKRFPPSEGFDVEWVRWEVTGRVIE